MQKYKVTFMFKEALLGTVAKDKEVYASYIASKAPVGTDTSDEIESVEQIEQTGWTGFHMVDGQPIVFNYVIKGYFKDAASMLSRVPGTLSKEVRAFKKIVDGLVFVEPRQIPLLLPDGASLGVFERPLRAHTAQGERIALARSDTCPAGTRLECEILVLGGVSEALLGEWLDYGQLRGLGQFRNGGFGVFGYTLEQLDHSLEAQYSPSPSG